MSESDNGKALDKKKKFLSLSIVTHLSFIGVYLVNFHMFYF